MCSQPRPQRRGGSLRQVPIADHDGVAAHDDLADLAGRQRPVLAVDNRYLDPRSRWAHRSHPLLVAGFDRRCQQRLRHRGDGAGTFALAVSVPEARAQDFVTRLQVGGVDRRGPEKQRPDVLDFGVRESGMANETAETSRRRKQSRRTVQREKICNFGGVESPARGQDLMRRLGDMRQAEESRGVRLRGKMEKTILRGQEIDVRQVTDGHRRRLRWLSIAPFGFPVVPLV